MLRDLGVHQAALHGDAAALAFAAALTARALRARSDARALLVQSAEAGREGGWAYGAGLQALGLDPDRLAVVAVKSGIEALRVVDEALKSIRPPYCWLLGESGSPPR